MNGSQGAWMVAYGVRGDRGDWVVSVLRAIREDPDLTVSVGREVAPASSDGAASATARPAVRLPAREEVVGAKYRIEKWLGQGGMGAVFHATQLVSEKPVALKWMLRQGNPQASARFLREARAAGRIRHPNVVDIYDVGRDGDIDYLVMELLRGESLRARLDRSALGMTEAVDLLLPAMHGIAAAHRAAVIHRDLKPDNVFLCEGADGHAAEAKVLDFGISQITSADAEDPAITREGSVLGTPTYMSPEQLRNASDVDVRTDVYSFGVILYEAVTGRPPFSDPSFSALVLAIAQTDPPAPSTIVADLPVAFEQVLLRAIARDRDRRFPDMETFIAAVRPFGGRYLDAHRGGETFERSESIADRRHVASERAERGARRAWHWVAAGLLLATSLLFAWWVGRSHRLQQRPAPSASMSSVRAAGDRVRFAGANERASDAQPRASASGVDTGGQNVSAADLSTQPPLAQGQVLAGDPPAASEPPAAAATPPPRARAAKGGRGVRAASRPVGRSGTISLDDM